MKQCSRLIDKVLTFCFNNVHFIVMAYTLLTLLLLLSGDIESNPGPTENCLSIIHSNIRSIRNKIEFIKNHLLDFDVLCFTETHLDASVDSSSLLLSNLYGTPYRKDRTNHGGGILIYLNNNIISQRIADLEIYWNESIWIKIKQKSESFLLGVLYSPKTSDATFFEQLNRNIESALDISQNVIIVGDFNDDLLNDNKHYLKDVLLINSFRNIIEEPTRDFALLDPILIPSEYSVLDKGVVDLPRSISDHKATFITIPFEYPGSTSYKRLVWLYSRGNYQELRDKIETHDWTFINDAPIDDVAKKFEVIALEMKKLLSTTFLNVFAIQIKELSYSGTHVTSIPLVLVLSYKAKKHYLMRITLVFFSMSKYTFNPPADLLEHIYTK